MTKTKNNNTVIVGEIKEILPNTMYKISLTDGREVLATPNGKMRRSFFKLFPGDRVKVEMTPYDQKRGRVVGSL